MRFSKECVNRLIKIEEGSGLLKELMMQTYVCLKSCGFSYSIHGRLTATIIILLREDGVGSIRSIGTIDSTYVSAKTVVQLRELKPNRYAFALAFEKLVYEDENEASVPVDHRVCTRDRVLFIQQVSILSCNCHESCIQFSAQSNMFQCVSKYFEVLEHLREDLLNDVKDALNNDIRRSRKANKDNNIRGNAEVDDENILTVDLFT